MFHNCALLFEPCDCTPEKERSAETKAAPLAPAKAHDRTAPGTTLPYRERQPSTASIIKSLTAQVGGLRGSRYLTQHSRQNRLSSQQISAAIRPCISLQVRRNAWASARCRLLTCQSIRPFRRLPPSAQAKFMQAEGPLQPSTASPKSTTAVMRSGVRKRHNVGKNRLAYHLVRPAAC